MSNKYFLTITIIATLFLFLFVYPQGINKSLDYISSKTPVKVGHLPAFFESLPFKFGLDLLGGAELVYEAQLHDIPEGDRADAMSGIRDVIERRVNLFGVSEPIVQVSGDDRLIVELAGVTDIGQAIEMIGQTPFLEFREEVPNAQELEQAWTARVGDNPTIIDFIQLKNQIYVSTGLDGKHLQKAQLVFDPNTGISQVALNLNDEGKDLFAEITKRNVGKRVAIFIDGVPISEPVVQTAIETGQAVISGGELNKPTEAKLLVTRLNSGALPVPISLVSQQTVGATLGADSLRSSLVAGIYGLALVAIFMIVFYRLPGVISVVALMIYVVIVLFIYKVLPVTLTLAGIAGFILSLGIAVDANVLIFARLKEELKEGKTLNAALKEGFSRAWLSIRDSHVTTIISSLILYIFTTSVVKGFALTLVIGVLMSLFTSISVTRLLLYLVAGKWFENKHYLFR